MAESGYASPAAPGPPSAGPATGSELAYHEIHRGVAWQWWRPLVGVLTVLVGVMLLVPLLVQAGFALWFALRGDDVSARMTTVTDSAHVTPGVLLLLNLTLAGAIGIAVLCSWVLHGLRPGWVASVRPGLRWRWLATCFGMALLTLMATVLVSALVPAQDGTELGGSLNDFTATTRDFLLVIVLLTPLQAAGEEYLFRGYLTQAFGGIFAPGRRAGRVLAVLLPAFLFALAHGQQGLPVFVDRLAFGLVAGVLVIVTGGLEAGIAMHVLNNFLAYGLALAFTDMTAALNPSGGSWWSLPVTLTQSLVYLGLATYAARRLGVSTRAPRAVLAAPVASV